MVGFPDEAFAELANPYSGIAEFFTDVNVSLAVRHSYQVKLVIPGKALCLRLNE